MTTKSITLAVSLLMAGLAGAAAPPAKSAASVAVSITRQPMADALTELGRQIGMQVVIDSELAKGRTAPAVSGRLTLDQAMRSILKDTGLRYEFVDERTIAVMSASAMTTVDASGGGVHFARTDRDSMQKVESATAEAPPSGSTGIAIRKNDGDVEIVVQGTRDTGIVNQGVIPRTENEAVRYEVIDRAAIERSGATSLSDLLLRGVPQSANYGTGTHKEFGGQFAVAFSSGGFGIGTPQDEINLRGLGSGQTLVLVNGRRLYGNSDNSGPDISRIPLAMVERVEILPSSGSAIYGANAVAGVVNIILRKDYAGREYTAYFGTASGGAQEYRLSGFQGFNFNDGRTNLSANFELSKIDPLLQGDRRYYQRALARVPSTSPSYVQEVVNNFIGPQPTIVGSQFSTLMPLGIPSNPAAVYAGIPSGSAGTGLVPASFNATAGAANISTSRLDDAPLIGGNESAGVFATLEHALGGKLSAYSELTFRWTDNSAGDYVDFPGNFTLNAVHPLNPFRTGVTPGFVGRPVAVRLDPVDVPRANQTSKQKSYRAVVGLRGTMNLFGGHEYKWSGDLSWDRNETDATNVSYTRFLRDMVLNSLYNPLRDRTNAPLLSADELRKMRATVHREGHPEIVATNWRANGDLFEAWGGTAGISVGAEYRQQAQYNRVQYDEFEADSYVNLLPAFLIPLLYRESESNTTRDTYAAFTEMTLPLVGERNRLPLVYKLDLSAAIRYEKYDDFEAAKPPMLALRWALSSDLALRAQFSEGFQPPTSSSLSDPEFLQQDVEFTSIEDPLRGGESLGLVDVLNGGNSQLRPETSDTWDAGVILTPRWIPGLSINAAYFEYDKTDLADYLSIQEAVNAGFVTRGPDVGGLPGPITQIDQRIVNVARQVVSGWDFKAAYAFETGANDFTVTAQATHTRKYLRQLVPTDPRINTVGDLANTRGEVPLKWSGRAALEWQRGGWGANWSARYTDSFRGDTTTPNAYDALLGIFRSGLDGAAIPSRIEHDVQVRYRMGQAGGALGDFLNGAEWMLGANNVFDKAPELITSAGSQWHSFYADPRQRFVYFQLKKSF